MGYCGKGDVEGCVRTIAKTSWQTMQEQGGKKRGQNDGKTDDGKVMHASEILTKNIHVATRSITCSHTNGGLALYFLLLV